MFDISWGKLMLIGIVALIVIGPKELPGVLRVVGQWVSKVRRMATEFQSQFQDAMREAEMADLKKHVDELNDATRSLSTPYDPLKDLGSHGATSAPTTEASIGAAPGEVAASSPGQPQPNGGQPSSPEVSAPAVSEADLLPPATEPEGRRG